MMHFVILLMLAVPQQPQGSTWTGGGAGPSSQPQNVLILNPARPLILVPGENLIL